jgi:hypothetical protein
MSTAAFVRLRRCQHARELLQSGASVTVTAERLGFANPFHFSRVFRQVTGDRPSRILSDGSFDQLRASEEEKKRLASVLFFHPNPSIQRVVTIATPHRGSDYANDYTQWLGRKLIQLPSGVIEMTNSLIRQNPDIFRDTKLLITKTSIDSLNPDSPIFPVLLRSRRAPWVQYHNIIGMIENSSWFSKDTMETDGIVSFASAQMEDAQTQIVVQANHGSVHTTPRAILEVRRILIEHLREACQKPHLAECLDLPEPWKAIHQGVPKRSTENLDWPVRSAALELPLEGRLPVREPGLSPWIPGKTIR